MAAQHRFVVTSTDIVDGTVALHAGRPAQESFGLLLKALEAHLGTEETSLFALPEAGYSRARGTPVVTWYTNVPDALRPLDSLTRDEADEAGALLAARLAMLIERADPKTVDLLRSVFNVPALRDIFVGRGAIVVTNWGTLGSGAPEQSGREGGSVLQRFLPPGFSVAARTGSEDATDPAWRGPGLAAGAGVAGAALAATVGTGGDANAETGRTTAGDGTGLPARASGGPAGGGGSLPPAPPSAIHSGPADRGRTAAAPLLGVAIFLAAALLYVSWPGNLVYAEHGGTALREVQALDASNAAFEGDIARLQAALGENVCRPDLPGDIDRLGGMPILRRLSPKGADAPPVAGTGPRTPIPGGPDAATTGPGDPVPADVAPEAPNHPPRTEAPPSGPASVPVSSASLLGKLDAGTVFVIGKAADGMAMGSGFLVASDLVLTNFHVVETTDGERLFVTNHAMGRTVAARVVARSQTSDISSRDFALLKLAESTDLPRLSFTTSAERLDSVIASGFPSFVLSSDPNFIAAFESGEPGRLGDLQMAVTRGEITAKQSGAGGTRILAHSATISPGNSGGPLIDMCGRIVGINTYTRTDAANALRLNFALASDDALAFLAEHGVDASVDAGTCSPFEAVPPAAAQQPANAPAAPPGAAARQIPSPPASSSDTPALPVPLPPTAAPLPLAPLPAGRPASPPPRTPATTAPAAPPSSMVPSAIVPATPNGPGAAEASPPADGRSSGSLSAAEEADTLIVPPAEDDPR